MGLDARYDPEQRKNLSAIAFKARMSQSLEYADADIDNFTPPAAIREGSTEPEDDGSGMTPLAKKRTEYAVLH